MHKFGTQKTHVQCASHRPRVLFLVTTIVKCCLQWSGWCIRVASHQNWVEMIMLSYLLIHNRYFLLIIVRCHWILWFYGVTFCVAFARLIFCLSSHSFLNIDLPFIVSRIEYLQFNSIQPCLFYQLLWRHFAVWPLPLAVVCARVRVYLLTAKWTRIICAFFSSLKTSIDIVSNKHITST